MHTKKWKRCCIKRNNSLPLKQKQQSLALILTGMQQCNCFFLQGHYTADAHSTPQGLCPLLNKAKETIASSVNFPVFQDPEVYFCPLKCLRILNLDFLNIEKLFLIQLLK